MKRIYLSLIFIVLVMALSSCNQDPNFISRIDLSFDTSSLEVTSKDERIDFSSVDQGDLIEVTITVENPFYFGLKTVIYVNNQKVDKNHFIVEKNIITLQITHPNPVDPNSYVDVEVTLNPMGGYWDKDILESLEPDYTLLISSYNDLNGTTFSLFDNNQTQLRWFYKLFLSYDESYDAYRVVYSDPSKASVSNLELPAYDYIIGAHLHTTDVLARDTLIELSGRENEFMMVRFNQDLDDYESGELVTTIWTEEKLSSKLTNTYNETTLLPEPVRESFSFLGWCDGNQIYQMFPRYQVKDHINKIEYHAVWGSLSMEELQNVLSENIPEVTTSNLHLPNSYSAFTLTWESSDPEVISETGIYKRPYQTKVVTLTVTVDSTEVHETLVFQTEVFGYKSLERPIASSYIYRNFELVDDDFFKSLDIINGAFITAQSDGSLIGASFLSNMETYILPKAKIYGNWVVPSIAPSSAWSEIAISSSKIEAFANNIVDLINEYGFDGVDIDWETPTTTEASRYTLLMRTVYQKVKENNPNHLVTTAITGGQWQPPRYDLVNSKAYIDYINLMTYGMVGTGAQYQNALYAASSYHNTQFNIGKTLLSCSIDESVKMFKANYQVAYSQIIVGVAFYGMRQTRTYNTSTSSWSTWIQAGTVHYSDIVNNYQTNSSYIKAYDTRAGVPYIMKNDGSEFISYDNPKSILEKSEYIMNQELAGMMYWENGLDTTGTLLAALRTGLMK